MTVTARKDITASIVKIIVESANPEKVILFGSRSEGDFLDESDYDFLIVVRNVDNEREVSRLVNRAILDERIGVPIDVVVVSEEKLHAHQNTPFYIYGEALNKGKIYYERSRGS